ncbi:MAG TPA: hypothetical protein VIW47_08360 [Nitrospiraceae bacterium]|jgi:hypothetical protein
MHSRTQTGSHALTGPGSLTPGSRAGFSHRHTRRSHTIGLTDGPFFHLGILSSQLSKLFGEALMPSWIITLTEPVGSGFTLDSSLLAKKGLTP